MQTTKPTVIAIAGASASGKTLLAQTIYDELFPELGKKSISIIKEDYYYRAQDHLPIKIRDQVNYDHPDAFDHDLLSSHLIDLINNKKINCPVYCYKTHTRTKQTKQIDPTAIILVEGILLFSDPELRQRFNIKVYMDTPLDICLLRRIKRDTEERDRTIESITQQYLETVRPMYYQYIEPSKSYADIIVTRGGKNRIAIDLLKAKIHELIRQYD